VVIGLGLLLGLLLLLFGDDLLLNDFRVGGPVGTRRSDSHATTGLGQLLEIGRKQERRPFGHANIGFLAVAGEAHIVEHLALELDAATAAKGKRHGERSRKAKHPASAGYRPDVPQSSPLVPENPGLFTS